MPRFKDGDWILPARDGDPPLTWLHVQVALLMDIRDELKRINSTLDCPNALQIPKLLRAIRDNTKKKSPRK